MRVLIGFSLMIGGGCGLAISILGSIVVSSTLIMFNGLDISVSMLVLSIVALVGGVYVTFLTD